jgi:hypothetical protein
MRDGALERRLRGAALGKDDPDEENRRCCRMEVAGQA